MYVVFVEGSLITAASLVNVAPSGATGTVTRAPCGPLRVSCGGAVVPIAENVATRRPAGIRRRTPADAGFSGQHGTV